MEIRAPQGGDGVVQHLPHRLRRGNGLPLQQNAAALFQRQRVDGDVVRPEGKALVQRAAEALGGVRRQTRNEIHIHMGKAHGHGQSHGFFDVRGRMPPADGLQNAVLQGLGVHADAVAAMIQQHPQLLAVDGIGSAGFDAVFGAARQVKTPVQMGQKTIHLVGGEGGGRAAAHIKALDVQTQLFHHLRRLGDLPQQHRQIRLHKPKALFHRLRHKAAVGTAGGAEGDADVEGDVLRTEVFLGFQPRLRRLDAKLPAGLGHAVGVAQDRVHLSGGHALLQIARGQLGGADAREGAPGGSHPRDLLSGLEKTQLHRPLAQALLFIFVGFGGDDHAGDAFFRAAAIAERRDGGGIFRRLRQSDDRLIFLLRRRIVHRPLLREKGQQALLHGIAGVVPFQDQLHSLSPCFT